MLKTFNAGLGMVVVVQSDRADDLTALFSDAGEGVSRIGTITVTPGIDYAGTLL